MTNELSTRRWTNFFNSLGQIMNMTMGVISQEGMLLSIYNPLPPLSELERFPALQQEYRAFFLKAVRSARKAGQAEILYGPLGIPAAVVRLEVDTFLILTGGFDQNQAPSPHAFEKQLNRYGIPGIEAAQWHKIMGCTDLVALKTKASSINAVYQQMMHSSHEFSVIGQKMTLLTAVDEISKLTVGLLHPSKFDLTQILELVLNSLIILCDAEGAFVFHCRRAEKQFIFRGAHEELKRSLQEQWEAVDAYDPACLCRWEGEKIEPVHGVHLHTASYAKENARVCLGVVNPLPGDIRPSLEAFVRQVNIATELSLLYELLQSQIGFLLNSVRHGIIALDRQGRVMVINRAAMDIFRPLGVSLAIGLPLSQQTICPSLEAAALETINSGVNHFFNEETLNPKNGSQPVILSWDISPLHWENGDIAGAILIIEDITRRKLAEEALRQREQEFKLLVENAPDIIARFNRDLYCTYINQAVETQMGIPREQFMGHHVNLITAIPDKTLSSLQHALLAVFKEGKEKTLALEFSKNENTLYFNMKIAPEYARDGSVESVLTITRNVTKQKLMEEELLKKSRLDSIGLLAGGIAHDFNNFLATMLGNISLAKLYGDDTNKIQEKLKSTEAAIMRSRNLTQQLFVFARGLEPLKKTLNLEKLIRDSIQFALSGSNVSPVFDIAQDLLPVDADEGQITQVINNIVINALQAMPEGGTLRVKAENANTANQENGLMAPLPEGQYVMFSIEDEGTGIPEKQLAKIFDPFFSTKSRGSGLGLSTAYRIIQKHNGSILVKSIPGIGTTFFIYLPASSRAVQLMDEDKIMKGTGKILLMDDEATLRETAGEMLTCLGYVVDFAVDGLEALSIYQDALISPRPFSAVILDLTIPGGMGGKETVAKLLAVDPSARVIVASGYSNDPVMANYRDYGFIETLEKPFKIEKLSQVLHRVLHKSSHLTY